LGVDSTINTAIEDSWNNFVFEKMEQVVQEEELNE